MVKCTVTTIPSELDELKEKYSKLEKDRNTLLDERNRLKEQLQEKHNQLIQMKIDIIAEMKMTKMMFEMVLSDGHTHRAKEWIAKLSNNVLDLNINKAKESVMKKLDYDDGLPF